MTTDRRRQDVDAARDAERAEDLARAYPSPAVDPAALEAALGRLPRPSLNERLAEAERLLAARKADVLYASDVLAAAVERYHRDPAAHLRAQLAGRVINTAAGYANLEDADDPAEVARLGAMVALELLEREQPTAEAKLTRVRALVYACLAGAHGARGVVIARAILEALEEDEQA